LSGYDGITVYMTRTADEDLTLKERAEYAKEM
jgi:N-acetylmuramoyl-L-alanine amidase